MEDLNVINEDFIYVDKPTENNVHVVSCLLLCFVRTYLINFSHGFLQVRVEFNPTVPHCSLATLIGLCIRVKIERNINHKLKLDIYIKKGTHSTEEEINKQINDKERIAAAMENPSLRELVESCIRDNE